MTKIKNFRIPLRIREVARLLKALQNGVPLDPAQETSLEPALNECRAVLAPAALYATMTRQTAVNAVPFELPKKCMALSAMCVTIGSGIIELRQAAEAQDAKERVALLQCIEQEALQQAVAFAQRLVTDQAKKEDCELTGLQACQEAETRQKLATLLGLERIGLTLTEPDATLPPYARLMFALWMPVAKSSSGKKASRPRAEKAAL